MKALISVLVFCLAALFAPLSAAKPLEIKSENFVFIGDLRETDAKALILELEQYRQAVLQLFGMENAKPEVVPVRIYSVRGDKELKLLTGRTDIAGVYKSTIDGPVFILNAKSGFRRGKQARHVALHEYTHHLLSAYTSEVFPLWFNEGLADYYATFEVKKDGNLVIGRPYNPYGYPLSQQTWMPTEVMVNSVSRYPYKSTGKSSRGLTPTNYFYAQSWLAAHYIKSTKGEAAKMVKYVNLINSGKRSLPAFEQAFGRTPEQFHQILRKYYRANRFSTVTVKPNIDVREHDFKARVMDKSEALFHRAEAMRFFSAANIKTAKIEAQYDKAAKLMGETAPILAARADLASWEDDYDKAGSYINQALALAPDNVAVLRTAGMVLTYKNEDPDKANLAELKKARDYLKQALRLNPKDIGAEHYLKKTERNLRILGVQ